MRTAILILWLLLPVGAWAYHAGPGQDRLALDRVDALLVEARAAVAAGDHALATERFEEALKALPADQVAAARRIRLAYNQARMENSELPLAHAELTDLVEELTGDADADPALLAEARRSLASARYYMTWLMRLEGQPREVWEPEIEAARQTHRLLAEQADALGDEDEATRSRKDLEAAVLLARMELADLQGLPLPSQ